MRTCTFLCLIQVVGTLYTHHQKCVIVDSRGHGNNRKITAFLGGLDMCDGRYDTPQHRLFGDLNTVFKDDFHNPTFPVRLLIFSHYQQFIYICCERTLGDAYLKFHLGISSYKCFITIFLKQSRKMAPRQPWHDLHCKIEGPAAYDVLMNFEQRWKKATKWAEFGSRFKKISRWHDDALIKIERISWINSPSQNVPRDDPSLWVTAEDDPENWHVQVKRLDCFSSFLFFK